MRVSVGQRIAAITWHTTVGTAGGDLPLALVPDPDRRYYRAFGVGKFPFSVLNAEAFARLARASLKIRATGAAAAALGAYLTRYRLGVGSGVHISNFPRRRDGLAEPD